MKSYQLSLWLWPLICHINPRSSPQRDSQIEIQYFPSKGRIDKMYFPYYGKKAHVSIHFLSDHAHARLHATVLLTDSCLWSDIGELRAAPGGREAAAQQGGLQQRAGRGVQGRGLRHSQQRREGQVPGSRHL